MHRFLSNNIVLCLKAKNCNFFAHYVKRFAAWYRKVLTIIDILLKFSGNSLTQCRGLEFTQYVL